MTKRMSNHGRTFDYRSVLCGRRITGSGGGSPRSPRWRCRTPADTGRSGARRPANSSTARGAARRAARRPRRGARLGRRGRACRPRRDAAAPATHERSRAGAEPVRPRTPVSSSHGSPRRFLHDRRAGRRAARRVSAPCSTCVRPGRRSCSSRPAQSLGRSLRWRDSWWNTGARPRTPRDRRQLPEDVVALVGVERAELARRGSPDSWRTKVSRPRAVVDDVELAAEVRVPARTADRRRDRCSAVTVERVARKELDARRRRPAVGACANAGQPRRPASDQDAAQRRVDSRRANPSARRSARRRALRAVSSRRFNSGSCLKITDDRRHSRLSIAG